MLGTRAPVNPETAVTHDRSTGNLGNVISMTQGPPLHAEDAEEERLY